MFHIIARLQRCIHVRTIVRIYIHCKCNVILLGSLYQSGNHLVIIWTHAVFCTDRHHCFIAFQTFSNASHIYRNHLCNPIRDGRTSAVSDLFIRSDQNINRTLWLHFFLLQIFGITKKNGSAEFVIQETALNISALCHYCSRIKTDKITGHDSQLFHIFLIFHRLIQNGFHRLISTFGIAVFAVYVNGSILQLEGCIVYFAGFCINLAVLSLRIVWIHAADIRQFQMSVVHDLADHSAKSIHVSCQNHCILIVFSSKLYKHSPLLGNLRLIAKILKFFFHKLGCHVCEAAWAWHCKQILCYFHNVICVFSHDILSCFLQILILLPIVLHFLYSNALHRSYF